MKRYIVLTSFLAVAIALVVGFSAQARRGSGHDARVLAHTKAQAAAAEQSGCTLVREINELRAYRCDANTAQSLGLDEDVRVFAADTGANTQIGASTVQASGNTGQGTKIVILDTGYNKTHPELVSSYLGGKDFVNGDLDPMDDNGHGSHVAGIITADGVSSQAKGVAPDAGIIAGKVLDASGSGYFSDVIAGIYWAVNGPDGAYGTVDDFHADAISMSLGTGAPYLYKRGTCDNVYPEMTAAIKYAKDQGVVITVAAGNSGKQGVSLPGCISYATTVGAVDSQDQIASFSGRGPAVDIVAPGVAIYSSLLGSSYASWSGTSMATPMVAGAVALIKHAHSSFTPTQVENALFLTAKDLGVFGKDTTFGWGRVNAWAAVQ